MGRLSVCPVAVIALLGLVVLQPLASVAAEGALSEAVVKALKEAPAYQFGQSRESLTVISDAVRDSSGNQAMRADLETRLDALLKDKTASWDAKQFVCRQLSIMGTDASVPVLADLLLVKETSEMARYALERIATPAVDKALLKALPKTSGGVRVGVLNSIGVRRYADAVKAVAPLALQKDQETATAALTALGKMGNDAAYAALEKAKGTGWHAVWAEAVMRCGNQALLSGDAVKATRIYETLCGDKESCAIRVAAFEGKTRAAGANAVSMVIQGLTGSDTDLQRAAAQFVRTLAPQDKSATEAFTATMSKLNAPTQVLLLSALADRGDNAGLPTALAAIKSPEATVRMAALETAGRLGGAGCVADLVQIAATSKKQERDEARTALERLRGQDVDAAMVAYMKKCEAAARAELARALAARNAVSAVPALLESTKDADETVRVESFKALAILATTKELPVLVDFLFTVEGATAREEAEKAVVAITKLIPEENKRAAAVLAVYPRTKQDVVKISMLNVLGSIGDSTALKPIRKAVKSEKKAEVKDAAVHALVNWPKAEVLEDLMKLAKSKNDTYRMLALRGAMQLVEQSKELDADTRLSYYTKAFSIAKTVDEKKTALGGVANARDLRAIALVKPHLNDEALKPEALLALEKIKVSQYKLSASENTDSVVKALDGKEDTRWISTVQKPGQWVLVDLGAIYEVTKVTLRNAANPNDFPRGYQLFLSNDKDNSGVSIAEGQGSPGETVISIPATSGRFLKMVQTGTDPKLCWSIHEIKIESGLPVEGK